MITIRMLADHCGLSISAVSKALNRRPGISPQKAELVRAAARELGYYPNAAARTLKTHRSYNLGILYRNNIAHEFFSSVLEGIHSEAVSLGYDITFLNNEPSPTNMSYYDHVKHRQCDGVVIVEGSFMHESVTRLLQSEVPVVAIDHFFEGHSTIMSSNDSAMREIVDYLHSLGHSRIAFIHGEHGGVTDVRIASFLKACQAHHIDLPPEYMKAARYHHTESAAKATRELLALKQRPSCILYPDDFSYLGGIAQIEQMGLHVPGDISCFGFDGILMAGALRPRLTTYKQDGDGMGRLAAREVIRAIEQGEGYVPRIVTVKGAIHYGETVKALKPLS